MNQLKLAFALGTGLTLSLATPRVNADPIINTLATPSITASQFNNDFAAIDNAPAIKSNFQLYNASNPVSGVMQSEVFKGTGQFAGLYAYAYQVSVSPSTTDTSGAPVHLDGTSFIFNGNPTSADLAMDPNHPLTSSAYLVTGGPLGTMSAPVNGTTGVAPASLSWQADPTGTNTYTGTLRANFVDTGKSTPPLYSGSDSATFVVLSSQPFTQNFVNLTSNTPAIGGLTSVYAADGTVISPSPVPEPSTILAWTGMAGAIALVRRVRKSRPSIV
jgi:hypothetical protein